MIQLIDVCKTYKVKRGPEVTALNHINLTFGEKGLVFILGKSGSGKSTLLNVIGGLDRADSGDIVIMGKSSKDFSQAEFDSYRNTYVGFIFQEYNILPDFTIGQNIALALQLQSQKGERSEVEAILDQVDLHGLYDRKPNELSGGQKQRVAIARALIKKPEIIMADEPTGALDSKTGQDIFNTLKKLAKDHLVICVSHDRDFAEAFGDRVVELKDGNIISDISKTMVDTTKVAVGVSILSPRLLSFEKGHVLTAEDISLLNSYLAAADQEMLVSSDTSINQEVKTSAKIDIHGKKGTFSSTTPELVGAKTYEGSEFHLKKSRLPFSRSLKVAFKSLRSKPFRLVATLLLIITSLTMFGISSTLAAYSSEKAFIAVYENYNVSSLSLTREYREPCDYYDNCYVSSSSYFSLNDIDSIREESGLPFTAFPSLRQILGYDYNGGVTVGPVWYYSASSPVKDKTDAYHLYGYDNCAPSFFEGSEADFKEQYNVTLAAGRMPTSANEVLISDFRYEAYQLYGYSYNKDSQNRVDLYDTDCSTMANFLAKSPLMSLQKYDDTTSTYQTKTYPIVGIVNTNFDAKPFAALKGIKNTDTSDLVLEQLRQRFYNVLSLSYANGIYGMKGFYDELSSLRNFKFSRDAKSFASAVAPITPDEATISKWYRFLVAKECFNDYNHPIRSGYAYTPNDRVDPSRVAKNSYVMSAFSSFYSLNSMVVSLKKTFFWVGFATACFAALLLATFIASSITYQKRQIGILRAIGARGGDVYGIFYNESMMITLSAAFVAEILTGVLDAVLSNSFAGAIAFAFPLFQFSIWVFLLILLLAVLTASLASFIPCLIISKKKPIDSINDK